MRSVFTTFSVLEALAEAQPVGVGALARELDLPKSTVQRSLTTLAEVGWIRPLDSSGHTRWILTARPLKLAGHVLRHERLLREAAAPAMADLARQTRETIHLTIVDGDSVILLDKIDSTHTVRNVSWVGGRAPLHASASGLAILAHLPADAIPRHSLTKYTGQTVTDAEALGATLATVRKRGYAINTGMWRDDVSAVAAAILDPTGVPAASLSISVPTYRLSDELRDQYGILVRDAAARVTSLWDGQDPENSPMAERDG
ncbi:IclR family transcriptional regulator [Streptomyces sp. NPDC048665]|uniref:IclR family transcriptional regulator n=1 Tax=Streptomyces sp. NPDC048665 TaxID=3155490 RepID=UPI00342A9B73